MIYFLYGSDDYSIHQRIKLLGDSYADTRSLSDESDIAVLSTLQTLTLFGEEQLIVVQDLIKKLKVDQLERLMVPLVVREGEKIDRRNATVKWLLKNAIVEEYKPLPRQQLYAWVKEKGYVVDYDVLQLLWDRHQSNLWAWDNELQKLSILQDSTSLDRSVIPAIATTTIDDNIFDFVDLFGERKVSLAFGLLESLLVAGTDAFYLHSMLVRQVRLLLLATEPGGIANQPAFVVNKLQKQRKQWTKKELVDRYQLLIDMDYATKTGQADLQDELVGFVLS